MPFHALFQLIAAALVVLVIFFIFKGWSVDDLQNRVEYRHTTG